MEDSELCHNRSTVHHRNTRDISINSIQECDKNTTCSYIQHTLLPQKISDLSLAYVEPFGSDAYVEPIESNAYVEPIESNGEFSFTRRTLLSSTTSYLWFNSVYGGELSTVSFATTEEPCIIGTEGISHSTPFKNVIRTLPALSSNTLCSPGIMRLLFSLCGVNWVQRELSTVSFATTEEPCIIGTRGMSHSTPLKNMIRTLPALTSNTLY
ncbi:hypothetical protein STEG23_034548 [Scotinomys teguina]